METLLLTWTIAPNELIVSTIWYASSSLNPEKRYFEYVASIVYYITQSSFDQIVFCENSNYLFKDLSLIHDLAHIYNKKFELLQFTWDYQKVLEQGYGYWDAECIDYAVDHSLFLAHAQSWYKCTWRYKILNINDVLACYSSSDILFMKWLPFGLFSISTAFFKTSTEFYKSHLYWSGEHCSFKHWKILEDVFYGKLHTFIQKWTLPKVSCYPKFHRIKNYKKFTWLAFVWFFSFWPLFRFFGKSFYKKNNFFITCLKFVVWKIEAFTGTLQR
jgi:hypothetical protein